MSSAYIGKSIPIEKCKPGMQVMGEVRTKDGAVLVTPGTILSENLLEKLKKYQIKNLVIYHDEVDKEMEIDLNLQPQQKQNNELTYTDIERYRPQLDLHSNSLYRRTIKSMEEILRKIEEGKDLDFNNLREITLPLVDEIISKNNILTCLELLKNNRWDLYSHSVNVAILSGLLGKWLRLSNNYIIILIMGGLLHDIGFLKIPKEILKNKQLSEDDKKAYLNHPLLGYEMVLRMKEVDIAVKKIILAHHETCDGKGFPFGLNGDNISLETKIISVADIFDKLYMEKEQNERNMFLTLKELYEDYFIKLDFRCLDIFTKNMLWNHIGRYVQLSDNRIGEVVFINNYNRFNPMIKIGDEILDLSVNKDIYIKKVM